MRFTEQNVFRKKSRGQIDDIIDHLYLLKDIPDEGIKLTSCKEMGK